MKLLDTWLPSPEIPNGLVETIFTQQQYSIPIEGLFLNITIMYLGHDNLLIEHQNTSTWSVLGHAVVSGHIIHEANAYPGRRALSISGSIDASGALTRIVECPSDPAARWSPRGWKQILLPPIRGLTNTGKQNFNLATSFTARLCRNLCKPGWPQSWASKLPYTPPLTVPPVTLLWYSINSTKFYENLKFIALPVKWFRLQS